MWSGLEQVVVIVPVDANIGEAQDIAEENWKKRPERVPIRTSWHLQLQDHDRDDNGENSIAEGFKAVLLHAAILAQFNREEVDQEYPDECCC